jgi:molybdate transport system substrate-binding protein
MRRALAVLGVVAAVAVAAGCGSSSSSSGGSSGGVAGGTLTVDGAASLTNVFSIFSKTFEKQHPGWKVVLNFAGSNQLAAEIQEGQKADVFAAASPKYPMLLQSKKLLGKTQNFATNTLVLAVPASNPAHITSVSQLVAKQPKMIVAAPAVPLGGDTQQLFMNLGISESQLNIVSQGTDAETVLAGITTGAADAAVVYVTDALAAGPQVKTIMFPAKAQATGIYPIGVLTGSSNKQAAQWWVKMVTGPAGQAEFKKLGFGAPPSS